MKRVDFFWRCQPVAHSYDARLLTYLREDIAIIPLREKILQALRAFWMPLAYVDKPEGERLALEAIYALEKHADYLRLQFGVEAPQSRCRERRLSQTGLKLDKPSLREAGWKSDSDPGEFEEFF